MKCKLIPFLVANLFAASAAVAADGDFRLSGSVGLGLRAVDRSGADLSKLNEFRDLKNDSVISAIDVKGRGGSTYLDFFGENLGLDDMYIDLKGGQYGVFKYRVYDDRLRHSLTWGARTPYRGVGGNTLTAIGAWPVTNVASWTRFDYDLKREDLGGVFEFSNNSPWYGRADVNRVTIKGLRPVGYAQGSSPGNGYVELPTPVDYETVNVVLEGGYTSKRGHFSVALTQSRFSNGVNQLNWQNGYFGGGMDASLLPPNNDLTKISVNGVLRQLPMGSTLAGRLTHSRVTSNFTAQTANLNSTLGAITTTAATPAVFDGNVKHTSASLSLTSNLARALDSRIYYNYYDKDNGSTRIAYAAGVGGGAVAALAAPEHTQSYRKNNLGVDLGYRVNRQNKLSGGFDWTDTKRDRADYNRSDDKKLYAELKNSSLDVLGVRVKYQYLERRSDFVEPFVAPTDVSNGYFLYATRRFDVASFDQNLLRLALDFSPAPLLDLGFEAIYKENKYKNVILGRTKDDRQEYLLNASYGDPNSFRVSAFGNVEYVQYDMIAKYVGQATCTAAVSCDPAAAAVIISPTAAAYTWTSKKKDRNYQVGVGADWPVAARLVLKASYIWSKTEGTVDFTAFAPSTAANFPRNIIAWDNTKRDSLDLKAVYNASKQWEISGGYAYERFRYIDDQNTGYQYLTGATTSAQTLSGAYANPDYTAHILYLMAKYKF